MKHPKVIYVKIVCLIYNIFLVYIYVYNIKGVMKLQK